MAVSRVRLNAIGLNFGRSVSSHVRSHLPLLCAATAMERSEETTQRSWHSHLRRQLRRHLLQLRHAQHWRLHQHLKPHRQVQRHLLQRQRR